MKKNFGNKPLIYPQPVLMIGTYDENGTPDIMNAAWGGVGDDHQVFLCLSPGHKTTKNILLKKEFTVSIATKAQMVPCDYLGIVSANDEPNKVAKSGLTLKKSEYVDAPEIEELPLCLHCKLISYEDEHCHLFGEIIETTADECILTDGFVDPKKLQPLVFDICNGKYYELGEEAGKAFSCGKALK